MDSSVVFFVQGISGKLHTELCLCSWAQASGHLQPAFGSFQWPRCVQEPNKNICSCIIIFKEISITPLYIFLHFWPIGRLWEIKAKSSELQVTAGSRPLQLPWLLSNHLQVLTINIYIYF